MNIIVSTRARKGSERPEIPTRRPRICTVHESSLAALTLGLAFCACPSCNRSSERGSRSSPVLPDEDMNRARFRGLPISYLCCSSSTGLVGVGPKDLHNYEFYRRAENFIGCFGTSSERCDRSWAIFSTSPAWTPSTPRLQYLFHRCALFDTEPLTSDRWSCCSSIS